MSGFTFVGSIQLGLLSDYDVMLDCRPDAELPRDVTARIIARLGLPITVGMSGAELIAALGKPGVDKRGRPGLRLLDFLCGDQQEYVVGCCVDDQHGLVQIIFALADYFEEVHGKPSLRTRWCGRK